MKGYVGGHRRTDRRCRDRRGVLAGMPCVRRRWHRGAHVVRFNGRLLTLGTGGVFKR